ERIIRYLQIVAPEKPLVRMDGVVAKVEVRSQIQVREHDALKVARQLAVVNERKARLEVIKKARVERAEASVHAHACAHIAITENERRFLVRILLAKQHGVDVELRAHRAPGAGLEESGLAQLEARSIFEQRMPRRLEARQLRAFEDDARPVVDGEAAQ